MLRGDVRGEVAIGSGLGKNAMRKTSLVSLLYQAVKQPIRRSLYSVPTSNHSHPTVPYVSDINLPLVAESVQGRLIYLKQQRLGHHLVDCINPLFFVIVKSLGP